MTRNTGRRCEESEDKETCEVVKKCKLKKMKNKDDDERERERVTVRNGTREKKG